MKATKRLSSGGGRACVPSPRFSSGSFRLRQVRWTLCPVFWTESPVSRTQSPVFWTESPVSRTQSPVFWTESPVSQVARAAPHRTLCPVSGASSGGRPCPGLEPGGRSDRPSRALPGADAPIARSSRSQPRSSQPRGTDRRRSRRCDGRRVTEARASPWASPRFARRPRRSRERSRNESGGFLPNGRKPPAFAAGARFAKRLIYGEKSGAAGRTRTPDPCITNALLYRLSYCGPILRRTILKVRCVVKAPMAGRGLYTSTRG